MISITNEFADSRSRHFGILLLFNALTDTEETLRQLREDLIAVQRQAEELFLSDTPQDGEIESETP